MKYRIVFQNEASNILLDQMTDSEPLQLGDFLQLYEMADNTPKNTYDISEIHRLPINAEEIRISIVLSAKNQAS